MEDINDLRQKIDQIDRDLVKLFEERMVVVEDIAAYKIKNQYPLKDVAREHLLIEKNIAYLKNHDYDEWLSVFFKDLMACSRDYQQSLMKKDHPELPLKKEPVVVYQGVEGSFSSIATEALFIKPKQVMHQQSFEETILSLYNEEADYAVLPIENSSTGAISDVYDLMLKYETQIVGDYYLTVRHHLIGYDLDKIKTVYSHEQGFKQSKLFLSDYDWSHIHHSNTAESVKLVKSLNDPTCAAIGSKKAAEVYKLNVLKENIQDHDFNTTRFVVLAKQAVKTKEANKISLVLRVSHEPKSLFKAMSVFAKHDLNMLKIESRPIPEKKWAYMFYIDIEGNLNDETVKIALEELDEATLSVLNLGNYYSRNGES